MSEVVKSNTNTRIYPSNWFEVNLNSVVNVNPESLGIGTPQDVEFHYIDISSVTSGVINWENVTIQKFKSSPSRARRVINSNDVLLCTVRPRLQAHAFAYWKKPNNYIASTGFAVLRANKSINPRFLFHLIFSEIVAKQLRQQEVGSNYPAVNETDVRALRIPLPSSVSEQQKIAEILDTVEKAIALTQTHINKLKQAKAGLLHDLLTKGIDEHGELRNPKRNPEQFKDSPLGKIPKGWEVQPLSSIAKLQVGYAFKSQWFQENKGIKLIRGENVGYGVPDWSDTKRLPWNMYPRYKEYELSKGDIIIGMDRTFTKSGFKISVLNSNDVPSLLVQRVGRFLPYSCDLEFLKVLLNSEKYKISLQVQQKGMDIPHLSSSEILEPIIPIPLTEEQNKIAQFIAVHDARINSKQTRLEKLKLLKLGLMSDLLTGKVRVKF